MMRAMEVESAAARTALQVLYERLRESGCAAPTTATGQLIRPLLSLAGARGAAGDPDECVWAAAAAVQLAHEASLVHDDIIDGSPVRRGQPTMAESRGVPAALVEGDHLLTTGYRVAASTGSPRFVATFAYAVERTVAGEKLQGRMAGRLLGERAYRTIVGMKSGELLGCALAASALVRDAPEAGELYVLGRRIGTLYQMLDDLLDYCPGTDTGKPTLGDFAQRRWTWPLAELDDVDFESTAEATAARMTERPADGVSPLRRSLRRFEREADLVRAGLAVLLPRDELVRELVEGWCAVAAAAVDRAEADADERRLHSSLAARVPAPADAADLFSRSSRTFSFAARLFPREFRERVTRLYAFCRVTDDLADAPDAGTTAERAARLDLWERLARNAHDGHRTGIDLLDAVMRDAAAARVPFSYVQALIDGMRMDVRGVHIETRSDLDLYCYRVAGVIGQWLTRMCGIEDPQVLERAACLGRAMQITNIVRDVGEDISTGRLYIPTATLATFDLRPADVRAGAASGRLPARYSEVMESLMDSADADYGRAMQAAPILPGWFRRAVVVAAHVYRGIHDGIRANGYDNLRRRAHTSPATKFRLAARALLRPALIATPALTASPAPVLIAPARLRVRRHASSRPRRVAGALIILCLAGGPMHARGSDAHQSNPPATRPATLTAAEHVIMLEARLARDPANGAIALDLARALFLLGVDDSTAAIRGTTVIEQLLERSPGLSPAHGPLLLAYDGAFAMLAAKHGTWPPSRLRAVRTGLHRLDAAVAAAPDDVEIRYLRLINTHYLPGFFGRRDSARSDAAALRRVLPVAGSGLPPLLHQVIAEVARTVR
jgi:15-cis-phytoene synthase